MRDLLTDPLCSAADLGLPVPESPHAVSVCLPRWEDVIGYEEGDPEVIGRFYCAYPRFFLHPLNCELNAVALAEFGKKDEAALVFPSLGAAWRCGEFIRQQTGADCRLESIGWGALTAVLFPESAAESAAKGWQHGGEIISSRLAETALSEDAADSDIEAAGESAREKIRGRLAEVSGQPADDIFLFSSGMAAIFAVHRALAKIRPDARSVQVEFPYVDALKVQQHFGPGVYDLSNGAEGGTAEISRLIGGGETLAGVYTELPSNPLLRTADLAGLAEILADHGAPLIVDDTVSTAVNVDALRFADVVTTSLTKIFSGVGDVMAGAVTLRPDSPFHDAFHEILSREMEDAPLFAGDAVVLERNSHDFRERLVQVNRNGETLFEFLAGHPKIERVWYPKSETPENYAAAMRADGGYSGLMSIQLRDAENAAPRFYDALRVSKGPSLGTNFTLACPYTLLAHYRELEWAESFGVSRNLIRIWAGIEDPEDLVARFESALETA